MKLSVYLSLSRHGVFYFRWPLPRTDRNCRPTVRISLRTRCPDRAGTLARYLASYGQITRDNKELARLRQDKVRELVRAYFSAQLDQYLEWINSRGLSPNALKDAQSEMLDHADHLDSARLWFRAGRQIKVQTCTFYQSFPPPQPPPCSCWPKRRRHVCGPRGLGGPSREAWHHGDEGAARSRADRD